MLKSHIKIKDKEKEKGITIILDPYLADKQEYCDSLPVSRKELLEFLEDIKKEHPRFKFDLSKMN